MRERGFVLLWALVLSLVISVIAVGLFTMVMRETAVEGSQTTYVHRFQSAENGIYAVAGWMVYYRRVDPPAGITSTDQYRVALAVLKETVRVPVGYSTLWRGFDVKLDSVDSSNMKEIESIVFVPVAPVGYPNDS